MIFIKKILNFENHNTLIMKKLYYIFIASIFIFLFSCRQKENIPLSHKNINELSVNDAFDWQTAADITFGIKKSSSSVIYITSEDRKVTYYKGFYNGLTPTFDVTVNIPKYISRVYVNNRMVDISGSYITVDLDENIFLKSINTVSGSNSLIAYWQFNENTGTVASDAIGGSNGNIAGAQWTSGINKSALNFNGTTGEVEVPTNSTLNITGDKISLSVWFKKETENDDGTFLFCRTKYILRIDNHGKITFAIYNPQWHSVTIPWEKRIVNTDWHHVVATYNGKYMKIYVDAVLFAKKSTTGNLKTSSSDIYIGSEHPINYFDGTIDEVALYSEALSKIEISQLYSDTPNTDNGENALVSWWKFNENSGNIVNDSKSNNNGTISGAVWNTGVQGSSLQFNGQDSYVIITNADNLNVTDQITMMAWAKTEENKTAKIAEKGDWDGQSILQDHWNGWAAQIRLNSNKSYSLKWHNGIPIYNKWYHIALTYNGTVMKLFVNGQLANSKNVSGKLHVNNRDFAIGSNNGTQKFFHGSIDDVRFFNKALSQTEIQAIFKNKDNSGNSDTDGDGVQNDDDDYPNDPARAFNNFMPAAGYGSLSFEDLWPGKGDYDFNDLVLDYRFTTVTNVSNKVVDVIGTFVIRAIGAGQSNGFGFQLNNNINQSDITVSGSDLRDNYIVLNDNGLELHQAKPTVIVFDDANEIMPPQEGFGVNVEPNKEYVNPDTIVISMAFTTNKYTIQDIDINRFNPFMIVSKNRGKEIHLPDYSPTSLVDVSYFGTMDDNSNPDAGRYYKTVNNLPWAINITESFDYLIEKNEITTGYLKFYDWAASSGSNYPDWYKNKTGYRNDAVIYHVPE